MLFHALCSVGQSSLQVPNVQRPIAYPPIEPTGPVGSLGYCLGFLLSFWLSAFLSDPSYPPAEPTFPLSSLGYCLELQLSSGNNLKCLKDLWVM